MTMKYQLDRSVAQAVARRVLSIEACALQSMADNPPADFGQAVSLMLGVKGRVVVSGMGKSGHVGRKIAATLASTGTPAFFLHPGEASHGDLGMLTADDLCLLLSNSGETRELSDLVRYSQRFDIPMVSITRDEKSTLAQYSNVVLTLPDLPEACSIGMAPTTSTTCALALGDALAVALMEERGFIADSFHTFHPGGKLGTQLLRVRDIMHTNDAIPVVSPSTAMGDALVLMSAKGFGVVVVVDEGTLYGVITDGDLRRNLKGLMALNAGVVATRSPLTAHPDMLVSEALGVMNREKISVLFVVEDEGNLCGVIHIHDCLRAGVE